MSNPEINSIAAVEPIPGMPRMEIVYKPISWFKEYGRNPRRNDAAVERMCASIREFGFAVAMLCLSTGEIVDGHLRFKGARKLDMQELPVVLCDHWTEAQVNSYSAATHGFYRGSCTTPAQRANGGSTHVT